ncbi:YtxH domain-containing protein [Bacteroides heparinolyticus]|uniref:YtxH domain-containing protein n=1 Tax=Prevotella heparinolytica TaxID=28113 RepID=UPI0035A00BFC
MANNNLKFVLGVVVGAAIGAASAYFSDRNKRERFMDDMSGAADKLKDSVVEGYYEAKDRYMKYRDRLTKDTANIVSDIEDELCEDTND